MNWLSTLLVNPRLLPRLDYSSGIAPDCRTMVVVPTMLTSLEGLDSPDRDPGDSSSGESRSAPAFRPADGFARRADRDSARAINHCSKRARAGIEMTESQICLRTAATSFSSSIARGAGTREKAFGWATNGSAANSRSSTPCSAAACAECFSEIVGETAILPSIKYVITLDTDTQLPRDSARQLVGTMAHPLNRPRFDPARGIVTEGYSLLQPRVDVSLPERRSLLVRPASCRRRGHRSLHARGLGRVSGFVSGRLLYRQRDLRGRCLRARSRRALPGEHGSEPRLAGVGPCPLRARERREILRRISVPLRRGHRPAAPLDSGRLADHAVAAAVGSGSGQATHCQSALRGYRGGRFSTICGAVSSRLRCCFFCWATGSLVPELGGLGPLLVLAVITLPGLLSVAGGIVAQAGATAVADASARSGRVGGAPTRPDLLTLAFLPYEAFVSAGCHRADAAAHAGDAQTAAGMADLE